MATEPLGPENESDVLERRRWTGSTKVYTRKKNKGQRNSSSSAAATVSVNDEVCKGTNTRNIVSRSEGPEIYKKNILIVKSRRARQPEAVGQVDEPLRELPSESCFKLGHEEEAGLSEVPVLSDKEHLVDGEKVGQEAGDSPGETACQKSKKLLINDNETGGPFKDLPVGGKEVLLSSRYHNQLQHEDAPSRGEMVFPGSNGMLLERIEVSLIQEDQLGQEVADQLVHEECTTHVETTLGSHVVLPENRSVLVPQEDSGRLGQGLGASGEETVRRSDEESLERRKVLIPPYSSGCDIADGNCEQLLELQQLPTVMTRVDDKLKINVSGARSSDEIRGVKRKLETELDQVRSLFKKLLAIELQVTTNNCNTDNGINSNAETINTNNISSCVSSYVDVAGNFDAYSQPQYALNDAVDRTLSRVSSEVGSVFHQSNKLFSRSLSVSVVDNNHGIGEFAEREKRTPKANQLYRNSEFLLGKDRLPSESNKKLKSNGAGRKDGSELERRFGLASDKNRERVFRNCSNLLQRLMKHNFGWVFNEPVDAKKLGLHDYHDIIKHPMDLGTIKARLSQNYYKSPIEFAEDVRLVFRNAMTYNPKGHDVHVMAETLLKIFEERWTVIETEYNPDWRYQMYQDAGLHTPTLRKIPATQFYTPARVPASVHAPAHVLAPVYTSVTHVPQTLTLENSQLMTMNTEPKLKPLNNFGRIPAPKKPKARDLNKRDMTYDEKQKLTTNLQTLPPEKLDAIVQIIKKRSSALREINDEIELDIDGVDVETLWELDRFVTNYRKSLSKNKRKAELALQRRAETIPTTAVTNAVPGSLEVRKETRIGENNDPPVQAEKQDHASRSSTSSSSSSSSSDSGSSSSDSDSDSSSSCGSDSAR